MKMLTFGLEPIRLDCGLLCETNASMLVFAVFFLVLFFFYPHTIESILIIIIILLSYFYYFFRASFSLSIYILAYFLIYKYYIFNSKNRERLLAIVFFCNIILTSIDLMDGTNIIIDNDMKILI